MRLIASALVVSIIVSSGCGPTTESASETPALSAEQQETEATRILETARDLEKKGQSQAAVAAYRHIVRSFPTTPQARKAGGRLKSLPH